MPIHIIAHAIPLPKQLIALFCIIFWCYSICHLLLASKSCYIIPPCHRHFKDFCFISIFNELRANLMQNEEIFYAKYIFACCNIVSAHNKIKKIKWNLSLIWKMWLPNSKIHCTWIIGRDLLSQIIFLHGEGYFKQNNP